MPGPDPRPYKGQFPQLQPKKGVEMCLDVGVIPRAAPRGGAGPLESPTVSIDPRDRLSCTPEPPAQEGPMGRL